MAIKKNTAGRPRKADTSYSKVEKSRLAKKAKPKIKGVPLTPMGPVKNTDPGFRKGPTPSPTPTPTNSSGMKLLGTKSSKTIKVNKKVNGTRRGSR